jgi:guanylate kinase
MKRTRSLTTMPEKGLLIVISGPSGSGKGTVLKRLFTQRQGLFYSVSATTREPRKGETEGSNYFFLSKEEFELQIENGNMLEYAMYCGSYYGTPRNAVEERLERGNDVILEIDVQGAIKIRSSFPDSVSIFLMPPSLAELEKRLRKRGTESEERIKNRLAAAKLEIDSAGIYDYIVLNDVVIRAAKNISCIITAEKLRTNRYFTAGQLNTNRYFGGK